MKKLFSLFIITLTVSISLAQFPGRYLPSGNFGNFGSGGKASNFHAPESWLPDSVPLRITKFQQNALGFYLKDTIDTTFHHFELLRPQEHYNDVWLGNTTSPWYANSFDQRISNRYQDFYFLNGFMQRIYVPSNNFYFRTNRPYTDMYYATSSKLTEQQIINTIHTQNVNYYTNFGLIYNNYASLEPVTQANSGVTSLVFWLATEKPKYRYNFVAFLNSVKLIENGGIIDTGVYYNPEAPQYYLTNGPMSKIGYRGFSFNPEYVLAQKGDSLKITTQTYFVYARHTHNYFDNSPGSHPDFYGQFYLDPERVFDSVAYDLTTLENNLKIIAKKFRATAAVGAELQNFYNFINYVYRPKSVSSYNIYAQYGLEAMFKNIKTDLYTKIYGFGRKQGDFDFNAQVTYKSNKFTTGLETQLMRQTPGYFLTYYSGNVDYWKITSFKKQFFWKNQAYFAIPKRKLYVNAQIWLVDNYINFVNALPYQHDQSAMVALLKLQKDFKLGFLHFDNKLTFQYTNHNEIFNLPLVMTYSSLWADFYLFKKALKVNAGADLYWNSGFKRYDYRPSIMAFYFDGQSPTAGGFPIVNAFMNFKIKRASIFLKLDYIDAYLNPQQFYAPANHYHFPAFYFRYGARWWFKN